MCPKKCYAYYDKKRICNLFTINQLIAQQLKYAEANVGVRRVGGRERTTRVGLAQISWADTCVTRCWVAMETELGQGRAGVNSATHPHWANVSRTHPYPAQSCIP